MEFAIYNYCVSLHRGFVAHGFTAGLVIVILSSRSEFVLFHNFLLTAGTRADGRWRW